MVVGFIASPVPRVLQGVDCNGWVLACLVDLLGRLPRRLTILVLLSIVGGACRSFLTNAVAYQRLFFFFPLPVAAAPFALRNPLRFRFDPFRFVSFRLGFGSFRFRLASFRFVWFRVASVSLRLFSVSFRFVSVCFTPCSPTPLAL